MDLPVATLTRRLPLPSVTVCAASSVNVEATLAALAATVRQIEPASCKLFTDVSPNVLPEGIELVPIPRLNDASHYSRFMLTDLADHVTTTHCLVVQWDGYVRASAVWDPAFLDYDYIGASWPQFTDGHDVGNGGFSLRSRRLLDRCRDSRFAGHHPEDVSIGRTNRDWLETEGMLFAPRALADRFSAERAGNPSSTFGFHGVFAMPQAVGIECFWAAYRSLDDHTSVRHDFVPLLRALGATRGSRRRQAAMIADRIRRWIWQRRSR